MYAHGAVAAKHLGVELFHGVISEKWREVSMDESLKATLVFCEKMTLKPQDLQVSDVIAAIDEGVERVDLEHAAMVAYMFNSMNRLVDAFGADLTEEQSGALGSMLNTAGRVLTRRRARKDPHIGPNLPAFVESVLHPIREQDGDSPAWIRRVIEARISSSIGAERPDHKEELPTELASFVDLIENDVWSLTDEHFDRLKEDWSEEAIYEMVYAACMASGVARLEVAWRVISEALDTA